MPARQAVWENTQVPRAWSQAGEVHTARADHGGLTGQAEGLELSSADGDEPWEVLKPGKAGMENGREVETEGSQTHEEAGHGWERGDGLDGDWAEKECTGNRGAEGTEEEEQSSVQCIRPPLTAHAL